MALVSGISLDPEAAICVTKRLPPKWIDGVDEVSVYLHNEFNGFEVCKSGRLYPLLPMQRTAYKV